MADTQQQQAGGAPHSSPQPNGFDQQAAQQPQQQHPPLPFPTLLPGSAPQGMGSVSQSLSGGPPGSWGAAAATSSSASSSSAPFPSTLPASLMSAPSAPIGVQPQQIQHHMSQPLRQASPPMHHTGHTQQHTAPPRVGAHVQVPAALLQDDDDLPPPLEPAVASSHSRSHSHGASSSGHSHDGAPCSHSHGPVPASPTNRAATSAAAAAHNAHGHSHGAGGSCSSGHDHAAPAARKVQPSWDDGQSSAAVPYGGGGTIGMPGVSSGPLRRRLVRMAGIAWFGGGDGRSVLIYICLKVFMTSLQLWWGLWIGNEGMVSSSFHTGFDVMALGCALFALLNAKYPARPPFSYGLDRQEVVSAFTNAVFLFFVATFMIIETFHTAYSPPELEVSDVVVALLGMGCDVVGLGLFRKYMAFTGGRGGGEGGASQPLLPTSASSSGAAAGNGSGNGAIWTHGGSSAPLLGSANTASLGQARGGMVLGANNARGHYENMHGVALHVLADLVGHTSLLGAVWIHARFPSLGIVFALSFFASAVCIIRMVLPLFRTTGAVLLMTTPAHARLALDRAMREVSFYDGVLEMRSAHWWTQAPGVVVGSMHVRIRADVSEQSILHYVHSVMRKHCALLTVQIEKDQMPSQWTTHTMQA